MTGLYPIGFVLSALSTPKAKLFDIRKITAANGPVEYRFTASLNAGCRIIIMIRPAVRLSGRGPVRRNRKTRARAREANDSYLNRKSFASWQARNSSCERLDLGR